MTPARVIPPASPGTDNGSAPPNTSDHAHDNAVLRELQALRRSEAMLRDFFETATLGLHWVGADGTILWANQAELDLLGYKEEEYLGRNIADFHADAEVIGDILACLSRGETLREYPARLRHRDGSIRHVVINSSVLFEQGKFVHTRCFTRDVTALKIEQEARQEQQRLDVLASRIGKHLIDGNALRDMLQNCTGAMIEQLGIAGARIWTLNESEKVLELQAGSGPEPPLNGDAKPGDHARIRVGAGAIGRIAAERKPYLSTEDGIAVYGAYPLIVEDHLVGVMDLFSRQPLSGPALQAVARVSHQIAAGIDRKRIEAALRASEAQLAAELSDTWVLQSISTELIKQQSVEAVYSKIVDAVATIMRSEFATMQMLAPERGAKAELKLLASRGLTPQDEKVWEWVTPDTDSTCGQALRTGKRAIAANVETCDFLAGTPGMVALLDAGIRAAQSTPLFSRSGKLLGMVSSHWNKPHTPSERDLRLLDILARQAADLIEREQAGDALRESRRHLHEIVEALPEPVYTTDAEGRITFFNRAAVEFSGRVPQLGSDSWCVTWKLYNMDGTPLPHDQCPMAVALKQKRPMMGCEAIAELPDGTRKVFRPYPTPLFDENGRLTGAVNMLVDITDHKRAEQTLQESEERFRAIVDNTPECVKLVAPDGTLLLMNPAGLAMVEAADPADVIGRSVYDLIAPEFRQSFRDLNERVCGGEKGSLEYDIVGLRGARRKMQTQAVPLRRPGGSVVQLAITRDITGKKEAEENLLLLGAIIDSSDDAIISKNLSGIITSWNQSAQRVFGYTAEEMVGQPVLKLIPDDRKDEEPKILARLQRGERVDHFETIRRHKDGTLLDISLTISPIRDSQGRIIGASKIARNITDRRRSEEAIRNLNAQLKADLAAMTRMQRLSTRLIREGTSSELLQEILDAGIALTSADMGLMQILDKEGELRIVAQRGFDQSFLAFFGRAHEQRVTRDHALRNHKRLIVEDVASTPVFDGHARTALLAAQARAMQSTPLVGRSGELLGVFSTHYCTPSRPSDRDIRMLDILARQAADLLERKRAEETRGQLSAIVEASGDAIYIYDFEGKILTWNNAAQELYGYTSQEIVGKSSEVIVPADRKGELDELMTSAREHVIRNLETIRMRRDGSIFPAVLTVSPIRDESGKAIALSVIARDITERKRAEDALRHANQDLEQFAYSASHDLQEPLRTIKIYSELLADRLASAVQGESAEFLEFLRTAATRMELLVRDLLAYTQVSRLEPPLQAVDANETFDEILSNLGGAITESGAVVTRDALPAVRVHSTHLRQIFQNLIGNAIKYRSEERIPAIHMAAERQDGYWIFSVRDNGIGIQPEFKEQIFGLFSRLHNSERYAGTGIGLAICQRIVERYHGRIWVESEAGLGSEFRFKLPV